MRLRIPQKTAAKAAGLQATMVASWEKGRSDPALRNLIAYARVVGLLVAVVNPANRQTLSSDPDTLISAIAAHRKSEGMLRGDVARRMGATGQQIHEIEQNAERLRLPTAENYANSVGLALALVFDRPRCCSCDPFWCRTDESGEHCATRSCGRCLHGCPAPDGECCEAAVPARAAS
ncbi:helix-turn-helix transcriptional regulator [Microbispora sp. RL4-1S]|uniref:Helix-turn-helix transcriptional regulator n=2 Tax=Microbispora oryzae TaxID=2806554 RepID=A0A940WGN9_9ACTN|nr:helix-turn-helix transcriptional regulator [Microbispora oryzae]MBP2704453.1 helix-turn-helix transcriptional regulator [Microbispora oryzae]